MRNLNVSAPTNTLGYGVASVNITKALRRQGVNVSLFPIGQALNDNELIPCYEEISRYDKNAPCIKIWHQHQLYEFIGKGPRIGFPIFELDTFNAVERHSLNNCDYLFVCSDWAKRVIKAETDMYDKTFVVPLGVDTELFHPGTNYRQPKDTIFLAVGKWEIRKGHDVLPQIFAKAFEGVDNVQLWMASHNPFLNEQQTQQWKDHYTNLCGDRVRFIPYMETQQQLVDIMVKADCGVFLSRAEGWNLELLEMMALGKHVICTDYAGHTQFAGKRNAHLVDVCGIEQANDGIWFHGQGNWARLGEYEINQAVEHMRSIHEKKQNNSLDSNIEGVRTAKHFKWKHSAEYIVSHLEKIDDIEARKS